MSHKRKIELTEWEVEQMDTALQFLINDYVRDIENFREISNKDLKAMSWLIVWKHKTFDKITTDY